MAGIEIDITSAQQEQPDIDVHPIYGLKGDKGERGLTGNGISSITLASTVGLVDTYNVNYTDGNKTSFTVTNGEKGEQGEQGIQGIQGETGATPNITVNASVNNTVGTPSVNVTKTGTDENPIFSLAFQNLKGETGSIDNVTFGDITGQVTDNIALTNAFNSKQDTLVSGTNIKTINNNSLLGSGNIDISNISNWSSNVSNCITEIPQDIILDLTSGTLTLKAGSKVYVPNGFEANGTTPKFDTVTISNDITTTDSASRNIWVGVTPDGSAMVFGADSATGTPEINTYKYYYEPSTNLCYLNVGASSIQASLPICIATSDNSGIIGLPNIFNGLGFIGSTVFILPNVGLQIPYRRNANGTLKNFTVVTGNIRIKTLDYNTASDYYIGFDMSRYNIIFLRTDEKEYRERENLVYDAVRNRLFVYALLGTVKSDSSNKLSDFKSKTVFHAADYNDVWAKQDTHVVVETYSNGSSWYRVYSDGWCEQGGIVNTDNGYGNVSLLKSYENTAYIINVSLALLYIASASYADLVAIDSITASSFRILSCDNADRSISTRVVWQACGYIA